MPDVLLYHYYFIGIEKPLVIQATCRDEARRLILGSINGSDAYAGKTEDDIIKETISEPVTGITKRIIDGKTFVWAGQQTGWLPETTTHEPCT